LAENSSLHDSTFEQGLKEILESILKNHYTTSKLTKSSEKSLKEWYLYQNLRFQSDQQPMLPLKN